MHLHKSTALKNKKKSQQITKGDVVGINPLVLVFGMISPGFEHLLLFDKLSLEGVAGFGKMWFVELDRYYEFGLRYYLTSNFNRGEFIRLSISSIALHTQDKKGEALSFGIMGGKRWLLGRSFSIDLMGGAYFSGDEKTYFKEINGNTTKSVDIGGPVRLTGNLQLGFLF